MAKPQKKSEPIPARKSLATKALPAKASSAKAAARLPLVKASAVKVPQAKARAARARGWEPTAPKPPAAKVGKHPVTELPRSTPRRVSSAVEHSPATEAQIVEALAGKLSTQPAGSRAGFSWLSTPQKSKPEEPEPKALVAPGPTIEEATIADVFVPEVKVEEPLGENLNAASLKTEEPAPEPITEAPGIVVPVVEELKAVEPGVMESRTGTLELPAWLAPAAKNERSLYQKLKAASNRIGLSLIMQGVLFLAFCMVATKDAPLSGLQSFLRGGIPLFAMILICIDLMSLSGTQRMLDILECERLAFQSLQRMLSDPGAGADSETKPDSFAAARRLAYLPSQIILGILLVVWLALGLTVWFL